MRSDKFPRRVAGALPVYALLLLHLPQDGGRWRLRSKGGGYAVNLGALSGALEVEGEDNLSVYNAKLYDRGDEGEVPAS